MTLIPFSELAKELKNNDLLTTLQHWEEEAPKGLSPKIRRLLLLLDSCHWQAEAKAVKQYDDEDILSCEEKTRQQAIELLLDWQEDIHLDQVLSGKAKTAKLLTNNPIPPIENIISSTQTLRKLHFEIQANDKPVAIQGLAGMGKTSLIAAYSRSYKGYYKNIAWITFQEDWVTSFIKAFPAKEFAPYRKNRTDIEAIHAFLNDKKTTKPSLLILNDFDDKEELETWWNEQQLSNWSVLISTSAKPSFPAFYAMSCLPLEDAKTLFLKHCPSISQETKIGGTAPKEEPKDDLAELLNYVDCHPLIVELLAKSIETNTHLSLPHVANDLKHCGLEKLQYSNGDLEQKALIEQYITRIFSWSDMTQLDSLDKVLIKRLAGLSPIAYTFEALAEKDCFADKKKQPLLSWAEQFKVWIANLLGQPIEEEKENGKMIPKERVLNSLNNLVRYGWLNKFLNGNSSTTYRMHAVIQLIIQKIIKS